MLKIIFNKEYILLSKLKYKKYIFNEKLIESILSRFLERSYIIEQKSLFTNNKK